MKSILNMFSPKSRKEREKARLEKRSGAEGEAYARFAGYAPMFREQRMRDFLSGVERSQGKYREQYGVGRRRRTKWTGRGEKRTYNTVSAVYSALRKLRG